MSPGLISPGWSLVTLPLCGSGGPRLVGGLGAQHGVQDVDAASCEAEEGGVVFLAFGAFAVVVGAAGRVGQGGERGQEERAFEVLVAAFGWVLAADGAAGAAGDRGEAGVGGQVSGVGNALMSL